MKSKSEELYDKFYNSINYERSGLFEILNKEFKIKNVLYPGSSLHITPSFYFNYVIYIDNSDLSNKFFKSINAVRDIINRNKRYRTNCYFKFYFHDYMQKIDFINEKFDLIISLYSNNVIKYFKEYLKKDGIFLYSDFNKEINKIKKSNAVKIYKIIKKYSKTYKLEDYNNTKVKSNKNIIIKNNSIEYKDTEIYYLLKLNT